MKKRKVMVSLLATALLIGGAVSLASCGDTPSQTDDDDEATVVSLEVTKMPTKTEYQDGENFDPTGMEISGVLDNGKKKVIPNEELRMPTKAVAYGDKSVTIKYGRLSVEVPITVKAIELTDFALDHQEETVEVGARIQLHATFTPENASEKGLTYSSSKDTVATVSESGEIRAVGIGDATITVKSVAKATLVKTVIIHVKATAITGLELDVDDITLKEGEKKQIGVTITPANATEKGVTYTSSEPTVASVSATGLIEALKEGKTTITVETVATNAQGQKLKEEFVVTVESISTKYLVAFRNADGTLVQGYKEGEIEVGAVPEFTAKTPRKAKDAEGVYVFRGFDKEILPYAASEEEVTYTAVYQKLGITATEVKIVESGEKLLYEVTFDAAKDVEGFKLRAMVHGGSWTTSDLVLDGEIQHNADGTFVARANLLEETNFALLSGSLNTPFIGKFTYDGAGGDIDLKLHTRCDQKRYRHDASGKVIEVNTLADDWDGVEGYDGLSEEFKNAIPAPTWDGLEIAMEPKVITKNGYNIELFTNKDEWNNASLKVSEYQDPSKALVTKHAELVDVDGVINYRISGEFKGYEADDLICLADLQSNPYYFTNAYQGSWSTVWGLSNGEGIKATIDKAPAGEEAGTWHFDIPLSSNAAIDNTKDAKDGESVYTVHFQIGKGADWVLNSQNNRPNLETETYSDVALSGPSFKYSIVKGNGTWNSTSLMVGELDGQKHEFKWASVDIVEEDGKAIYKATANYSNYTKAELEAWTVTLDFQKNGYNGGAWDGSWDRVTPEYTVAIDEVNLTYTLAMDVTNFDLDEYIGHMQFNYTTGNLADFKPGFSYDKTIKVGNKNYRAFCVNGSDQAGDCYGCAALEVTEVPAEHDEDEEPNVGEHGIELSATEKVRFEAEKVDTSEWVLAGGNDTAVVERADASDGKFLAAATGNVTNAKPAYFKIYVPETKEYDIAGAFAQVESKKSKVVDMALTYQFTIDNTQKIAFTGTLNAREDITVWQVMELARASLTKGNHDVKLEVVSNTGNGTANIDYFEFTPVVSE